MTKKRPVRRETFPMSRTLKGRPSGTMLFLNSEERGSVGVEPTSNSKISGGFRVP